jgi:hypothetical protein
MSSNEVELQLVVAEAGTDPERLEALTGRLMRDLRELGADSVTRPPSGAPPEGAMGDAFTLGALALVAVPAFLPKLVEFLQEWVVAPQSRRVKIKTPAGLEVEFTPGRRLSEAELLALVEKLTASSQAVEPAPTSESLEPTALTTLRQNLSAHFSGDELRTLCISLDVDYDGLPDEGEAGKVQLLVTLIESKGRVEELMLICRRERPDIPWE